MGVASYGFFEAKASLDLAARRYLNPRFWRSVQDAPGTHVENRSQKSCLATGAKTKQARPVGNLNDT
jgi:hypothetical protein